MELTRVVVYARSNEDRYFVLIDVDIGPLLAFIASMKATVCSYEKYVSVSGVYTREESCRIVSKRSRFLSFSCKPNVYPLTIVCVFSRKRLRVNEVKVPAKVSSSYLGLINKTLVHHLFCGIYSCKLPFNKNSLPSTSAV